MDKDEFLKASFDYFFGAFSTVDENLSDGAWWQMHEDIADSLIDDCCSALGLIKPENIDGNDIAHFYFQNQDENK